MSEQDREAIWTIIAEGIAIRDEGIKTEDIDPWRERCLDWQARLVESVKPVWPNLARGLEHPMGDIDPTDRDDVVACGGRAHQKDVDAMSTIIRLVRKNLMRD